MTPITINDELCLCYPQGFHELDEKETQRFFTTSQNRKSIYDENRHILISIAWTKPGFLNYLTDAKTILYRAESGTKRGLPDYRRTDLSQSRIGGKKAQLVRYEFTALDSEVEQCGEMAVFRAGNKFYALTFVARKDGIRENRAVYDEIVQSITLK